MVNRRDDANFTGCWLKSSMTRSERAYHLARGAEAPDREIAVRLELAAQAASRRGAPETGAELLEQAARLTPLDAAEARRSR